MKTIKRLTGICLTLILGICTLSWPTLSEAQDEATRLFLRPHCMLEEEGGDSVLGPVPGEEEPETTERTCPTFAVEDPQTLRTPELMVGDILDMDLVLSNPDEREIKRVRTWLTYDPNILEGEELQANESLPVTTPGEFDFAPSQGYVQMEASSLRNNESTASEVVVARIQMRVKSDSPTGGTIIGFYDVQRGGHTTATAPKGADEEEYILDNDLGILHILIAEEIEEVEEVEEAEETEGEPLDEEEGTEAFEEVEAPEPAVERTAFTLLQVQNLRATTEGTSIFLGWDTLQSSRLSGYNLYYGTVSGQYIQRKTLSADSMSLTIRDLTEGTKYFFSIRAFNSDNEESSFSHEVAITVSDPTTSTSPLVPGMGPPPTVTAQIAGGGVVPGDTGMSSTIAILLFASALIGTVFAFRRQLVVQKPHS